jgi:hypothetical protein
VGIHLENTFNSSFKGTATSIVCAADSGRNYNAGLTITTTKTGCTSWLP